MPKRSIRRQPRANIGIEVAVTAPDGSVIHGTTRDVSTKGVFVLCNVLLPEDSTCSITLSLDGYNALPIV